MFKSSGKESAKILKCENCGKIGAFNYFCTECWTVVWEAYYYSLVNNDDMDKFLRRREEALILRQLEQGHHDYPVKQRPKKTESVVTKLVRCFSRNRRSKDKADFQEGKNATARTN